MSSFTSFLLVLLVDVDDSCDSFPNSFNSEVRI